MDNILDDEDEAARQEMASNIAKLAAAAPIQQDTLPDKETINRLVSENYTMRPELREYLDRTRSGVNEAALAESQQNKTWNTFDKLGDIRANTYGLKNVAISNPSVEAQTEADNVNKLVRGAELGDIQAHGKIRNDLALALARKRGAAGDSKLFLRESSGYTTTSGKPVLVHNDPNTGVSRFFDMDKNPLNENDVIKTSTYNRQEDQKIEQAKHIRNKADEIGKEAKDYADAELTFRNIDDLLKKQTGDKYKTLEEVKVNENILTGPEVSEVNLPGITIPFIGRKSSTFTDPAGGMNAFDSQRALLSNLWTKLQSGLTVSDQERKSIEKALEQGGSATEGEIIRGLQTFKKLLANKKQAVIDQYGPEAAAKYRENQSFITPAQANTIPNPQQVQTQPTPTTTPNPHQKAIDWARANPTHKNSAEILRRYAGE